jgi:hypothetical protein
MHDSLFNSVVTLGAAIVSLAVIAVLVSRNSSTAGVIGAATQGFAADIGAAVSPITGGNPFSNFGTLGITGGSLPLAY